MVPFMDAYILSYSEKFGNYFNVNLTMCLFVNAATTKVVTWRAGFEPTAGAGPTTTTTSRTGDIGTFKTIRSIRADENFLKPPRHRLPYLVI